MGLVLPRDFRLARIMADSERPDNQNHFRTDEFVRLLLVHQPRIYAFILGLVHDWADAEEIFQDTCTLLWGKFGQYSSGSNFCDWACQIAKYKVLNFRKRRARNPLELSDAVLELVAEEQLRRSDWDARYAALIQCRDKLRPLDRDLLDRCYASGVTAKSVAKELGRPADTIYKSLKRIRGMLYECIRRALAMEGSA